MTTFLKMLRDESGASAAEYALILAIVGSVIAIAALGLGTAIGGRMTSAASCISGGTSAACAQAAPATPPATPPVTPP